jgi:hypothetical protein
MFQIQNPRLGFRLQTPEDTYTWVREDARITASKGKTTYGIKLLTFALIILRKDGMFQSILV